MGVMAAFAYLFPNTELFIMFIPVPVKAKWAMLGLAAIDLFGGVTSITGDNIAHFAHLGGAITGFLLVYFGTKPTAVRCIDCMNYSSSRRLTLGDSSNALIKLVAANLIVFITLSLCKAYLFFFYQDRAVLEATFRNSILPWFLLPASPSDVLTHWWTVFTFPFANLGIWMVIGNMLWLWAFGFIFKTSVAIEKLFRFISMALGRAA